MTSGLSDLEIRFFRDVGYLRLEQCVQQGTRDTLYREGANALAGGGTHVRLDESGRPYRVDGLVNVCPEFRTVFCDGAVVRAIASLLGPNIELVLNRHNHLTLNRQGNPRTRLHRDVLQWSRTLVTAILYLEDSSAEGGATTIIPSSHFLPFVGTPNNGGTWMDEHHVYGELAKQAIPVPMRAGDVLLLDSVAFHATGVNQTSGTRMIATVGYHSVDELCGANFNGTHMLVHGERLYRGNDRLRAERNAYEG